MKYRTLAKQLVAKAPLLDGLFRRFAWSRVHFPEREMEMLADLPPGSLDVAIDVGAARGSYAWIMARKARQVFAFEPGEEHFEFLRRMARWSCIEVTNAAVGSESGFCDLFTPGSDDQARHSATLSRNNPVVAGEGTRVQRVRQVTLDSFVLERLSPGRRVDVLKVDVEGYELEVLRGAARLIAQHHPLVICELEARHNPEYPKVFELMRDAGYHAGLYRAGRFESFEGTQIESLQTDRDRDFRLSEDYRPRLNRYVNNFVFQHPETRVKVRP